MASKEMSRKFNGKVYRWYTAEATKREASSTAKSIRLKGYLARIELSRRPARKVMGGVHLTPWQVYIRKK